MKPSTNKEDHGPTTLTATRRCDDESKTENEIRTTSYDKRGEYFPGAKRTRVGRCHATAVRPPTHDEANGLMGGKTRVQVTTVV